MQQELNLSELLDSLISFNYSYLLLEFYALQSLSPGLHRLKDTNPQLDNYSCRELIKLGEHQNPQKNGQKIELWLIALTGSEDSLIKKLQEFGSQETYQIKYISKQIKIPSDKSLKDIKFLWSQLNMIEADSNELGHSSACPIYQICELPTDKKAAVAVFSDPDDSILAFATLFQRSYQNYKKIKFVEYSSLIEEEQNTLYIDIRKQKTVWPKINENKEIELIKQLKTSKSTFEQYRYHEDRRLVYRFLKQKLDGYQIYFVTTRVELAPTDKQKPMVEDKLAQIESQNDMNIDKEESDNQIILSFETKQKAKCLFEQFLHWQVQVRMTFV